MSKKLRVLSLFDGQSCGQVALERANLTVDKYFASEVKKHAIEVTMKNYPNTIQLGDVTKIKYKDGVLYTESGEFNVDKIDLLIGGSPCQDFSNGNKEKKGLKGQKSSLFYEYLRLLKEVNPTYFLLENVKMEKSFKLQINKMLNTEPILINSSLVSGQLRARLYWTNIPNVELPEDKNIKLQDILEYGYTDRVKSRCLLESDSRPLTTPVKMFHRYYSTGFTTLIFKDKNHYKKCKEHYDKNFKGLPAKEIFYEGDVYDGLRYLTKNEREILQTLPKGYCDGLTDNDVACLCGDGWTVDVIAHILKNIKN